MCPRSRTNPKRSANCCSLCQNAIAPWRFLQQSPEFALRNCSRSVGRISTSSGEQSTSDARFTAVNSGRPSRRRASRSSLSVQVRAQRSPGLASAAQRGRPEGARLSKRCGQTVQTQQPRTTGSAACHAFSGSARDGMARVPAGRIATALSELREPVKTAQQVLGHTSPETTLRIYAPVRGGVGAAHDDQTGRVNVPKCSHFRWVR
jgi:hypothetical protein